MKDDIKIREIKLPQLFNKLNNAKIPYFQREYTWTWNQIEELIEDIKNSRTNNYYTGSIVIQSKNDEQWILDGQQRISTFILIVNELTRLFFSNENEIVDEFRFCLKNIDFQSSNIKDGKILKKIIETNDYSSLPPQVKESIYFKQSESIGRLLESLENEKKMEIFIKNLSNVIFAYISVDSASIDSNVLFEKINSTGIKLSEFDLVKNYLLSKIYEEIYNDKMVEEYSNQLHDLISFLDIKTTNGKIKAKEQKDSSKQKEELIRSFISFETTDKVNFDEIYKWFKELYNDFKRNYKNPAQELFNKLKKYAIYYKFIFTNEFETLNKNIKMPMMVLKEQLGTFDTLIIHIFMLNSEIENEKIIINSEQVEEISKLLLILESYIFRRTFTGYNQRVITRKIPTIKIDSNNELTYRQNLYNELYIKPNSGDERELYKMPKFEEFFHSIKNDFNMYQTRKIAKIFLFRLGTFKSKENFDIENFSIEHILPQNYSKWNINETDKELVEQKLNSLGNLSLTAYNSEYSNDIFAIKKEKIIEHDNFPLNSYFLNINEWNINEIDKRTIELLNICNQIWNFNDLDVFFANNLIKEKSKIDIYQPNLDNYKNYNFKENELFKTAITNRSNFAKVIDKFNYDTIVKIIEHYVCDSMTYVEIENYFFDSNFFGWLGQSIIEALNIDKKNDKGNINPNKLKRYIDQRKENILLLLSFVEQIKSMKI